MITTMHTATVLVAHRQAELRAQGHSARIARDLRTARRHSGTVTPATGFSLAALARRFAPAARRPALI